jgi:PKHD-type hydroxylase
MFLIIRDVLTGAEINAARAAMDAAEFVDGRATAGWHARLVKSNEQVRRGNAQVDKACKSIAEKLLKNPLFQIWARPKALSPVILSRYKPGMSYGSHVDDALMQGLRTDISFTVFLAETDAYDGGSLVIETTAGEEDVKLEPGSAVVYPATTLHRVEEVSRGERLAAVGWAQSYIRDAARRELLFDLETARRQLFEATGKTPVFDLVAKSCANLLRMWADD